ncbi:hypothetical protein [Nostoc sp. MG11]|nr:hypothetical protein [Nostoc sp. MG11]
MIQLGVFVRAVRSSQATALRGFPPLWQVARETRPRGYPCLCG